MCHKAWADAGDLWNMEGDGAVTGQFSFALILKCLWAVSFLVVVVLVFVVAV